jgi:glycerol uptake facilitator-like aquaporin
VIDHAAMAVIDHAAMAVIDRAVINPAITIADHVGMIPRTVSETKQTT